MSVVPLLLLLVACRPPAAAVDQRPVTLTIAAINDFHGALFEEELRDQPGRYVGGLPWLAGSLDALRTEDPDLIVLDGGDLFQGSWAVNQSRGRGSVEAYNLLRVDAAAIGNHEFDYGGSPGGHPLRGALEAAAGKARFAWLTSNISVVGDDGSVTPYAPPGIAPWTVIERKGVKLGVIGLTTTDTPSTTLARHVVDLRFGDPVEAVRAALPAVQAAGADAIAVVGHLTGHCEPVSYLEPSASCTPDGEIGRLLTELPPGTIDVLVAGHAHTLIAQRSGDTFVLENRARGHAIGLLDLVIGPDGVDADASRVRAPFAVVHDRSDPGCDGGGYNDAPQELGGRVVTPSTDAMALVRALEGDAGSLCDPVACTEHRVLRARAEESGVGNLVADAMRAAFTGAEVAVANSGGLRADLPMGMVRRGDVVDVMPFDNRLILVEMSGRDLELMLRIGSSGAHGVLQVSGAAYAYDPESDSGDDLDGDGAVAEWEVDRLCSAWVTGAAIDPERTYRVVTTDFLLEGGDDLGPAFANAVRVKDGPLLRDHLAEWMKRQPACLDAEPLIDPSWPRVEQRPACASGTTDPPVPTPDPTEL